MRTVNTSFGAPLFFSPSSYSSRSRRSASNQPSDPFSGGGQPTYDQWAEYESNRLGTRNGNVINPEQYQFALTRNARNNTALRGANVDLAAQGRAAAQVADPWASQRGQYQTSLSQLMNNPGAAMQNNPFFKWQTDQGLEAVNRKMAASGGRVSGNRMAALSDYAQNQSGQQFFQLADLYSLLGGAKNQNPAAAAQLQYRGAADASNVGMGYQAGGGARVITDTDTTNFRPGYFV